MGTGGEKRSRGFRLEIEGWWQEARELRGSILKWRQTVLSKVRFLGLDLLLLLASHVTLGVKVC